MKSSIQSKSVKQTNPFRYAIGMFGTSIPINMFKAYAVAYYVDKLFLITAKEYSLIALIYTFIDAIDNPIYGFLSDRTKSPWGRRKPWLVIGTPLLILCYIAFFNAPSSLSQGSGFWYVLVMYILTGTLDSLINASYGALFPELFKTEDKRAITNAMRQAFQLVAMIISLVLTPIVTDQIGYTKTSIIYGVIAGAVLWFCAFGCREEPVEHTAKSPSFFSSIISILSNKKFWISGFANAFYSGAMALVMQGVSFYAKYTLGQDGVGTSILMGVTVITAIGCVFVWFKIIKKITLIPAWRMAFIMLAVGLGLMFFAKSMVLAAVFCAVIGFGMAGVLSTMDLVWARMMDEDTEINGVKREGIYSSVSGFMNRLSGLFVSAAFFLVSVFYGYEDGINVGNNPEGAGRFLMVAFPFILMLLGCVVTRYLNFPKKEVSNVSEEN